MSTCTINELIAHIEMRLHANTAELEDLKQRRADPESFAANDAARAVLCDMMASANQLRVNMTQRIHIGEVMTCGVTGAPSSETSGRYRYAVQMHLEGGARIVLECKTLEQAADVCREVGDSVWLAQYHEPEQR